ncbi:MAG: DUF559 domain-containing protein [Bacteroidales bacterium]|nr:DUF559 domain-containing protein [Bacteroidales bacterium]
MNDVLISTRIRIKPIDESNYELSIRIGDSWTLSEIVSQGALDKLRDEINNATGISLIIETFKCREEEAKKIKKFWDSKREFLSELNKKRFDKCRIDCTCKDCYNCVINCQSPLERQMLLELHRNGLTAILQRRINKDGSYYDAPKEVDSETILTIPDFYIEKGDTKVCIYADGHTYHERTEYQAQRDRNIDRELQRLGFIVLRYTGNEIRNDCQKVIDNIKENLPK